MHKVSSETIRTIREMNDSGRKAAITATINSDLFVSKYGFCQNILIKAWGKAATSLIHENPDSKLAEHYADAIWEG
tara:strand:+ start:425 stop:652 length:228 start_codon:yes stop_codon:yes gene_type:complete